MPSIFLALNEFGDALDQLGFVDLVGNFGDDDILAVLGGFFDGGFCAHDEAAAARLVGGLDAFATGDVRAGRKIGTRHNLHDFFQRSVGLFDQQNRGVNDLAQIVRRDVGSHADGDTAGAVHQKIGNARWQNDGLFAGLVEVGNEVDGLFFQIGENVFGNFRQPGFGIPHGRRWVAVNRAEVSLAVNQRIAHVEVLRQPNERGIDDRFTVRVIISRGIAADFCALAVAAVGGQAQVVHGHQDAPLHGLQTVAHVGESAGDDDAHGVVEVRLAHFGFDIDGKQYRCVLFVGHVSSCFAIRAW